MKIVIELCGISQVCDEVFHVDVGKVDMKPKRIRDCAVGALRLRRRRVKRLKASKRHFYLKVMSTRQKYALARWQLVLDLSVWNMLNNCVGAVEDDNRDYHDDVEDSLYVEDQCMVCSNIFEYTQVQPVGTTDSEVDDENKDEIESVSSRSQGSCGGNLDNLDDVQFDALIGNDMMYAQYHEGDGVAVGNGDGAAVQEATEHFDVLVEATDEEKSSSECCDDS